VSERADAIRNRAAILDAADTLFRQSGHLTLATVAETAGVGKATVLRRFGDLNGLVEALIAPKVTALQDAIAHGASPLGPGGDVHGRLHAYLDALLDFVLDNRVLIRALENRRPHAYYANPASQFWIAELDRRLRAAHPPLDSTYLAHAVFTSLRADVIDYVEQHMSTARIRAGLHVLARCEYVDAVHPQKRTP
jgi:AcrR family transcriptional regulator